MSAICYGLIQKLDKQYEIWYILHCNRYGSVRYIFMGVTWLSTGAGWN